MDAPNLVGQHVPSHFNVAIVAASFFASFVGCLLTIEMLHRRVSGLRNLRSWIETLICATSFGVIGIWCMHFIGNRAIILGDGSAQIQLVYSPGFTVLSVFLPIIGLSMAFSVAEYPVRSKPLHWCLLTVTGVFAGLSIVGMHYLGNIGISNYSLEYAPAYLAASVVIAIGDCMIVLILFYKMRESWISAWWRRWLCALILAGGVSAMHFTASTHCSYVLKDFHGDRAIHARNLQVIIAGALCGAASLIILGGLVYTGYRTRLNKSRSRKIMLACAMFDPDGRILVTTEGLFPSREITDKYLHRTFGENFDTSHEVFRWIFRVTRNWAGVSELIPKMKRHLAAFTDDVQISRPVSSTSSEYEPESYSEYTKLFKEKFCVAAGSLAASMHLPVDQIGVLYDRIVESGTMATGVKLTQPPHPESKAKDSAESELGFPVAPLFGRGQLLFLTRQLDAYDVDKLLNAGHRFASAPQVSRNIANTLQIPASTLESHIQDLKHYVDNLSHVEKTGTWLACFAVVPKPHRNGFDVAVKSDEREQLPDAQLLFDEPQAWQSGFLDQLDGKSPQACRVFLEDRQGRDVGRTAQEKGFAAALLRAVLMLSSQVPMQWFQQSRFSGRPVFAHYSRTLHADSSPTIVYAFVVCGDLHTSIEASQGISRSPYSFFVARHQCYRGSPNNQILINQIHQEFSPLFRRKAATSDPPSKEKTSIHEVRKAIFSTKSKPRRTSRTRTPKLSHRVNRPDDGSDTHELVEVITPRQNSRSSDEGTPKEERENAFGGILVNSETVIKSDSTHEYAGDAAKLGLGVGVKSTVATSTAEPTFAEELFEMTRRHVPNRTG